MITLQEFNSTINEYSYKSLKDKVLITDNQTAETIMSAKGENSKFKIQFFPLVDGRMYCGFVLMSEQMYVSALLTSETASKIYVMDYTDIIDLLPVIKYDNDEI